MILATHNLTLKSVKEIGKTKEHRRILFADESGAKQDLLWWNSTDEELPDVETKMDVAFSLRSSTYRGEKQLTLQFQDFRVVEEKPIEIQKSKIKIIDRRGENRTLDEMPVDVLVWAEGTDKNKGVNRFDLHPADEFAVHTTPPSPVELYAALEVVKPKTIYLFGVPPAGEKIDEFLSRLAGMMKFTINQRGGKASIKELAAATAHREATIRLGLEWLRAGGHLKVEEENGELNLANGDDIPNPYLQRELYVAVKGLLEETAAYRNYFSRADAVLLIKL